MRTPWSVVALSLLVPSVAAADVWKDRVLECPPLKPGIAELTTSSHVLYVNDCKPNGCPVTASTSDSALTNTSSIANANTRMSAYMHSDDHFARVTNYIAELTTSLANQPVRLVVDKKKPDPKAACVQ